jgi:hypothetical protein
LFAVTPVVAALLAAVAVVAVVVHNTRHDATASPTAYHSGVTSSHRPTTTRVTPSPTPSPTPTTPTDNPALATAAVNSVDSMGIGGISVGVAVLDRNTNLITSGRLGAAPFYSASVIKLFTVTYLLHQQEVGAITLDSNMQNNITRALELSDDDAMNAFWNTYGGAAMIPAFVNLYGLQNTSAPAVTGQWGETTFSPNDVLKVYLYAMDKLSQADANLIIGDLSMAANVGADGFNQAFGLLQAPRPPTVKAKQGWMQLPGDSMTLNSTGVLGTNNQYVVAILTKQPMSVSYDTGRVYLNQAAQVVEKALAPGIG